MEEALDLSLDRILNDDDGGIYKTRLVSNEIFSPPNIILWEVGRAKDLSAPRY